jgi:hypothetical protein
VVRRSLLLVGLAVSLVAACGDDAGTTVDAADPPVTPDAPSVEAKLAAHGLDWCEALDFPRAPDDAYRDEPVYVGNEQPTDAVKAWAATKPGYQGLWIDRERHGWISVGFTEGAEARQEELREEFPDVGVVAVQARSSSAERDAARRRVEPVLRRFAIAEPIIETPEKGLLVVGLGVLREEALAALEPFADEPLCFEGLLADEVVPDGPQPDGGEGWRLLGTADEVGEPYRTGIATTEAQFERLWEQSGLPGARPAVDFGPDVVIWFGAVHGSGCDVRLDDVVVDRAAALVHGAIVLPGAPRDCPDDAIARSFVVTVARSRLPGGPFAIQLDAEDPPGGVPEERTLVDADLRAPGSVATDDEIGPDPELIDDSEEPTVLTSGEIVEPGFASRYEMDVRCGIARLGDLNGIVWQTAGDEVPPQWAGSVEDDRLVVDVLVEEETATLAATANGHTVTYEPAPIGTSPDPCAG